MTTLKDLLNQDGLLKRAGAAYFDRGLKYFQKKRVRSLAQDGEHITANVIGTSTYEVHLWLQDGELLSRCSCPLGQGREFCKHCVAVGLAWIEETPIYRPLANVGRAEPRARAVTTMQDVRDYLARQDHATLVEMILEQSMEDSRWRDQLRLKVALEQPDGVDVATVRQALRDAISVDDFVAYDEVYAYCHAIQTVLSSLEELIQQSHASDVIDLCEEAISMLEVAMNSVDDSSGYLSIVCDQVQELHYRACQIDPPDPQALAERLFYLEMRSNFGLFANALKTYADILGDEGMATYGRIITTEEKSPSGLSQGNSYRQLQLNRIKTTWVKSTGTLEDVVQVIAQDLSQPSRYFQIVQLYQSRGQQAEAIAWAEKGIKAFANIYYTGQLGDFLIAAYEAQGRLEDAIAIVWQDFERNPSLEIYQRLKQQADKAQTWPTWRERALTHIQAGVDPPQQVGTVRFSLLTHIFIWEGDGERAWQAAQTFGCLPATWMKLAALREADHPEDALSIYQPAIEPLINAGNNDTYRQAVDLLSKVKGLMTRLNRLDEFDTLLNHLATTYKRRRNFIALLKQRHLLL